MLLKVQHRISSVIFTCPVRRSGNKQIHVTPYSRNGAVGVKLQYSELALTWTKGGASGAHQLAASVNSQSQTRNTPHHAEETRDRPCLVRHRSVAFTVFPGAPLSLSLVNAANWGLTRIRVPRVSRREQRADNLPLTQLERHWPTPPTAVPRFCPLPPLGTLGDVWCYEGQTRAYKSR